MSTIAKKKLSASSGISCHAWNGPRNQIALCPYTNEVHVYEVNASSGEYKQVGTLSEHEQLVAGVDWASERDMIVTCAHDRNAYVWERSKEGGGKWEPQMSILPSTFNRAALCVQWSPQENKFALGGGSKSVAVCYYQEENNWWISKLIRKKHMSSVTCVRWHSNNWLLATGSSDFKCRLFAANIASVDVSVKRKFGELLMEVDVAKNWVHGLSWSPSCSTLAICAHDSCVHVIDLEDPSQVPSMDKEPKCYTIKFPQLPQCAAMFLDENRLVSVGFHDKPLLFRRSGGEGGWVMEGELNAKDNKEKKTSSKFANSLGMFNAAAGETKAKPTFARVKTEIKPMKADSKVVTQFSVSGMDQSLDTYTL